MATKYDVIEFPSNEQIMARVIKIIRDHHNQVARLAPLFEGETTQETIARVFAFQRNYLTYVEDGLLKQHPQEPARFLQSRIGDCKSYAILTSSLLMHLGIPHVVRFVSYGKPGMEHVYVVASTNRGPVAIDATAGPSGKELPFTQKKDYPMELASIGRAPIGAKRSSGTIRFLKNGIKDNVPNAKLQRVWYGMYDNGDISITAKDLIPFSKKVREAFYVKNLSDATTDYSDVDRIRVSKINPLRAQVEEAYFAQHGQKPWLAITGTTRIGCRPTPTKVGQLHPNQVLSPSQLSWERARDRAFQNARISSIGRTVGIPAAVISEVVQNNLDQPVDTQVKRSLVGSLTKNPYLMEILTGELKGIPVIGPLLDKLFGKCGVFAGFDRESQAQLARVNDYYQYTGRDIIPPKSDAECNWRTTVHPSRVAIELNAEREAIMVQFQVKHGTNELAKLMIISAEAFAAAMEQKNYWPGWGDMLRYRNSIIADWKKQSNGDGGILTVELMLAVDSLRIAARQVYGFTYVPGQIPPRPKAFEQTNDQLLNAADIPKSADKNPGNSNTSGGGGALALALATLGFLFR